MLLRTQKTILMYVTFFVFYFFSSNLYANESLSYSELKDKSLNNTEFEQLPEKMLYPDYFRKREKISCNNILEELIFKLTFLSGRRPEKEYIRCYRFQRRITKFVGESIAKGELKINQIDNNFLFKKGSGIENVFSTLPKSPLPNCNFHSFGDLNKKWVLYCDYHGIDLESEFFKQHQKELEASKPFITSEDIAEFIVFSPVLIMLLIILLLLPKKKKSIEAKS